MCIKAKNLDVNLANLTFKVNFFCTSAPFSIRLMFSGLSKEGHLCPLAVVSLAVAAGCPLMCQNSNPAKPRGAGDEEV